MYLFDTDILSNIVKAAPSSRLLAKLAAAPPDLQFTTAVNIGEIYYGASRSPHRERIIQAFEARVFPQLEILPFDEGSGKVFGVMKAALEKKGRSVGEPDLRIAAIALQHKLILITGNEKHYKNIPRLVVENWL